MHMHSVQNIRNRNKGFTLIELLISVAILMLISLAVSNFQKDIFALFTRYQGNLNFELGARGILKDFSAETREASPSSLGSYPIEEASTTEFIFYSDADNDGKIERIRYFLSGSNFKKGVIKPSGSPLQYATATEAVSLLASSVVNGTTPIFSYYDTNYTGTSSPLSQPVSVSAVRLVKMLLMINPDPSRNSSPYVFTTEVSIRNLKDNL
jgi:prepilin-type N-terminal cleavage/methylation domain-containing protein